MARYPGARWRPITEELQRTQRPIRATQIILHETAVDLPSDSLYGYWESKASKGIESHLLVAYNGYTEQYVDTVRSADANYKANRRSDGTGAISVETEGLDPRFSKVRTRWTPEQLERLHDFLVWGTALHGIPRRVCRHESDPGIGFHTLFPGVWTNVDGKTCPGAHRKEQFYGIVMPRLRGLDVRPADPSGGPSGAFPLQPGHAFGRDPDNHPELWNGWENEIARAHVRSVQREIGLTGTDVDGIYAEGTEEKAKRWQASMGLAADGRFGLASWRKATEVGGGKAA